MRSLHLVWLALLVGCAPALSSFTPAHVAPRKHVQAEMGIDVSVPTGTIVEVVDAGETLSKKARGQQLDEQDLTQLFRAGAALALNPPSAGTHVGVGYSLLDHFELNGRYASGAWRLGARYQILEQADQNIDLSVGLGGGHYAYEFPISDQIPFITLEDFSRWQVDLPVLVGRHGDWYRWWAGPKLLMTFYGTELDFSQPAIPPDLPNGKIVLAKLDGTAMYVAGQAGAAVGYKYVFFAAELTLAKFWTTANLKFSNSEREVELDSFIIYPGFALLGEF